MGFPQRSGRRSATIRQHHDQKNPTQGKEPWSAAHYLEAVPPLACHSIGGCRCSGKSHPGAIGAFPVGNHNEVLHTPDVSRYRSSGANGQRSPQKVGFEITLDWSFSWVMLAAVSRTQSWVLGKLLKGVEARAGIEPAHKGFADLSLTTWVPRLGRAALENLIRSTPP